MITIFGNKRLTIVSLITMMRMGVGKGIPHRVGFTRLIVIFLAITILSGSTIQSVSYGALPIIQKLTKPVASAVNQTTTEVASAVNQTTTEVASAVNQTVSTVTQTVNTLDAALVSLVNNTLNIEIDLLKPFKTTLKNVDTKIFELLNSTDIQEHAETNGLDYYDGKVRLDVELGNVDSEILNKILTLAEIEIARENRLQISIPVENILTLSSLSEVKKIKSPQLSVPNKDILVDGQLFEDSVFTQKQAQNNPVTIAVIDLAFDNKNPKIINNVVESVPFRKVYGQTDPIKGTEAEHLHGTAMAEIITSVAPNSKLYLLTVSNEVEFLDAVDYAISKKVNVMTISSTWINHDTDGQSIMTKKVSEAISSGITVIIPSGNYAENHWEGFFADSDADGWHDFTANDEGMTIYVSEARISEKKPIFAYLKWGAASQGIPDFDLTLSDSQGIIVDYSSNIQDAGTDELIEYINFLPKQAGMYSLGIACFSSCSTPKLEIFSAYDKLEYFVTEGSVGVPTDAKGAIVVGALANSKVIKPYSSKGPTDNGLDVPNFFSPDGIITASYEGKAFFGTSSSAAYVTGLMAILFSEHPSLQPQFVVPTLINDMTGFGGKLNMTQATPLTLQLDEVQAEQLTAVINDTQQNQLSLAPLEIVTEEIETEALPELPIETEIPEEPTAETPTESPIETQPQPELATKYSNQLASELYELGIITEDKKSSVLPQWYDRVVSWWKSSQISDAELRSSVNYLIDRTIK